AVELDVHSTLDGEIVVHYDFRLTSGLAIAGSSLAELRRTQLADGSPIPTLSEAFEILGPLKVWVEAKALPSSADARLLELVSGRGLEHTAVHSFDHRIVARLALRERRLETGVLTVGRHVDPAATVLAAGARTLWQQWELVDAALVRECAASGVSVIAWTVPDDRRAALTAMGVAGLCCNL